MLSAYQKSASYRSTLGDASKTFHIVQNDPYPAAGGLGVPGLTPSSSVGLLKEALQRATNHPRLPGGVIVSVCDVICVIDSGVFIFLLYSRKKKIWGVFHVFYHILQASDQYKGGPVAGLHPPTVHGTTPQVHL